MTRFLQKGLAAKSMDVITEVWINSILTSPVTHMVNIAGNASFMGLRNLETYVAAGFGAARSAVTGSQATEVKVLFIFTASQVIKLSKIKPAVSGQA